MVVLIIAMFKACKKVLTKLDYLCIEEDEKTEIKEKE